MKQQINLYQPPLRIEQPPLAAHQMGWALLALALLLMIWVAMDYYRTQRVTQQLEHELAREQSLIQGFTQAQQTLRPASEDPELAHRVKRLAEQRQLQQLSIEALQSRLPGQQVELRARLEALARQHPSGLWLTRIRVAENGELLALEGRALSPALITEFLQRLSQEPAIAGLQFRQVLLGEKPEQKPDPRNSQQPGLYFEVATRHLQADKNQPKGGLQP